VNQAVLQEQGHAVLRTRYHATGSTTSCQYRRSQRHRLGEPAGIWSG